MHFVRVYVHSYHGQFKRITYIKSLSLKKASSTCLATSTSGKCPSCDFQDVGSLPGSAKTKTVKIPGTLY